MNGLVHFDNAIQKRSIRILDRFSNAVTQIPSSFVGYFQRALELVCAHAFFGFTQGGFAIAGNYES